MVTPVLFQVLSVRYSEAGTEDDIERRFRCETKRVRGWMKSEPAKWTRCVSFRFGGRGCAIPFSLVNLLTS